jgi:hypothetical protein
MSSSFFVVPHLSVVGRGRPTYVPHRRFFVGQAPPPVEILRLGWSGVNADMKLCRYETDLLQPFRK